MKKLIEWLEDKKIKAQIYRGEKLKENDLTESNVTHGKIVALQEVIDKVSELAQEEDWITDRVPTKEECGTYKKGFQATILVGKEYRTVYLEYQYTTIRGKEVSRWLFLDRIAPWQPIAWKPLSEPYVPAGADRKEGEM